MLIVLILGLILLKGIQESTKAAAAMVIVKLAVILVFVGAGMFFVQPENWTPFAPSGINGIVLSTFIIFYAYIGFDTISTAAEETKNPQKNLPIGLIGSLIVCSILYALVAIVFTGIVPVEKYSDVDLLAPIAFAVRYINQPWIAGWISIGALAGLTSALLIFQYGNTRILYSMGRDNFLPKSLTKIDTKSKVPYISTWITTIIVMLGCIFMDANVAAELGIFGTLTCFIMVCVGVILMRIKNPNLERPFRVPLYPLLPIAGILVCGYLIITVIPQLIVSAILFPIWIIFGCLIYFSYGYKKKRLADTENQVKLCPVCGNETDDNVNCCRFCGNKLIDTNTEENTNNANQ